MGESLNVLHEKKPEVCVSNIRNAISAMLVAFVCAAQCGDIEAKIRGVLSPLSPKGANVGLFLPKDKETCTEVDIAMMDFEDELFRDKYDGEGSGSSLRAEGKLNACEMLVGNRFGCKPPPKFYIGSTIPSDRMGFTETSTPSVKGSDGVHRSIRVVVPSLYWGPPTADREI